MFIIPKKYDAAKVRLKIKKEMAERGADSVLVPELTTLYDIAREKAGVTKGQVIMKEDFFCLMDQVAGLPEKFKGNNREYKKAVFSLLNQMAFENEDLASYPFRGTVEAAQLTRELCKKIYDIVKDRGFIFRAEIYRKALEAFDKNPSTEEYTLIPGEYYTKLEKELLAKLGVKLPEESTPLNLTKERMGFIKAGSVMEQYTAVKNHILAKMNADKCLDYDDFCVVVGSDESHATCTAYFSSIGFHCISAIGSPKEDELLDALTLLAYAIKGDTEKLVLYYNRHNPTDKVFCDDKYEFPHLSTFCKKLSNPKCDDISEDFKKWIVQFNWDEKNKKGSAKEILEHLQTILKHHGIVDHSLYEYEDSIKKVFGDTKVELSDMVEYFKNILAGRKRTMVSPLDDGVVIVKMGEYIPPCRFTYFLDLEEDTFLKDTAPNRLLTKDEHDDFNNSVYGLTKEQHLKECFKRAVQYPERIFFVIPQYTEGTVVSEYVEDLLLQYPSKKCDVKILGGGGECFEHEFPLTFDDVEFERIEPYGRILSSGDLHEGFKVQVNSDEEKPLDFVLSRIGAPTRVEAFMSCPARFAYEWQQPDAQLRDDTVFEIGNAMHDFCKEIFNCRMGFSFNNVKSGDLEKELANYILGIPCDAEIQDAFDKVDAKGKFAYVKDKYPEAELNNQDFLRYLNFICRAFWKSNRGQGPLCDAIPDSFRTEVFIGNADILKSYGIRIVEGYIDLMFKNNDGSVTLIDYKTGMIKSYADEVKSSQNVQLLIYSHVVQGAVKSGDMSVFTPTESQLEKVHKRESTILEPDYFADIEDDAEVKAYYASPKGNENGFVYVSGINKDAEEPFDDFTDRLKTLLGEAEKNIFSPCASSKCDYCDASSFCSVASQNGGLEEFYKKLDWHGPYTDEFPVPGKASSSGGKKNTVNIICFDQGDKKEAVTNTKDDILISAGAGAGKTEVLTSRYLNLLLNTDADLENILCITFTDKATGEMKKRIFKKIKDTLSLGRFYSVPDSEPLTEKQVEKLKDARRNFFRKNRISTFHAFCLDMLKKYEKENPDSSRDLISTVAEDYVIHTKKVEIFKRLIGEFQEKSPVFASWVEYQKIYLKGHDSELGLVPTLMDVLTNYKLSGLPLDEDTGNILRQKFGSRRLLAKRYFEKQFKEDKDKLISGLEDLLASEDKARRISALEKEIADISENRFGSTERVIYKENPYLKKLLKSLSDNPANGPDEQNFAEESQIHSDIFDLLMKADAEIDDYKLKNGQTELSDYHLDFIRILKNEKIRKRVKDELEYIMVDEFQDTNWLQKSILDFLHDSTNHLFIVGDLKQSIYRFQQCDNQIFKFYRQQKNMINLSFCENFRSVSDIVEFNNTYFTENQTPEYNIIEIGEDAIPVKMSSPGSTPAVSFVEIGCDKDSAEGIARGDKNELLRLQEATFIARTIYATGSENYGKWGILIRSYGHVEVITDALNRMGIPYSFTMKKDFFTHSAIKQVIQILSVVYGYSSPSLLLPMPELSEIASSIDKDMISKGFGYVVSRIISHKRFVSVYPILEEFLVRCRDIAKKDSENIEEIYCELLKLAEENCGEIKTSIPNSVQIMTVHSAKGLEFDYLFLSKITSLDYNRDKSAPIKFVNYIADEEQVIDFDPSSIARLDGNDIEFSYSKWMQDVNDKFDSEERGNLLYVALTRAKKHLVVTVQNGDLNGGTVGSDVNWYKNIMGNIFEPTAAIEKCKRFKIPVEQVEPLVGDGYAENEYSYEVLSIEPPRLLTASVSRYLDFIEEEGDPELDDKMTDVDEYDNGAKANEVGTLVHSFFEKNIRNLHTADPECFELPKSQSVRKKFFTYVKAGLDNSDLKSLVDGADALMTESAMIFRNESGNLLNGVIDLIVKKGDTITVLDYKTHNGSALEDATLERYRKQVRLYAYGLSRLPEFKGFKIECSLLVMFSDGMSKMIKVS